MLTLLIWLGSGFAFAVGVALGVWVTTHRLAKVFGREAKAEELLAARNEIGRKQYEAIMRLGDIHEEVLQALHGQKS